MKVSHIAWNVGGMAVPLLVAVVTIPGLIEALGKEKFGLLALAWGLIGYAGALDLGLGRALTRMVAQLEAQGDYAQVCNALSTTARLTFITGSLGAFGIALAAGMEAFHWIKVNNTTKLELQYTMLLLAIALPAQAMSATYKGVNEAYLNFKGINILRAALGIVNFAGPWMIAQWTNYLPLVVSSLVVSRLAALFVYRTLALNCVKHAGVGLQQPKYSSALAKQLFSFGGWITVSSVVGPMLVQADRFVIAGAISAAAVAAYILPYELVTQSLILAGAISSVMYPHLARLMQEQPQAWRSYLTKWVWRVALLMASVCTTLVLAVPFALPLWIHTNLDSSSILVGQVLCIGVFFNSIGVLYYAAIHAAGRADITAKLHIIELPLFLMTLHALIFQWGIVGAAAAWVMRSIIDTLALLLITQKYITRKA